jgi:acyl transferase domain-containing protein/enoyl-CoA hydratase/carnithine racemase/acyl carrier protein/NAD(P)-dependent dehydrogenase (short-subunit alcohol dehydrogenase family)
MLEIVNRYAHGLVAVPVIVTLHTRGFFDLLGGGSCDSPERLAARLGANEGQLRVALRLLESMRWIRMEGRRIAAGVALPGGLTELAVAWSGLLRLDPVSCLRSDDIARLASRVAEARACAAGDARLQDFATGVWVLPAWLALKHDGVLLEDRTGGVPAASRRIRWEGAARAHAVALDRLWCEHGWTEPGDDGDMRFTAVGGYLHDRIATTAALVSYRPMFGRIDDLLCGDVAAVFARDEAGRETHVDRNLNVRGSGFQHHKFFADLDELVAAIFDGNDLAAQPRYIADMGCGDGSLLRRIYEHVRSHTRRGAHLGRHPLLLIGVDYNQAALDETTRTLADLPHIVVRGDINAPDQLIQTLRAQGIDDPDAILHVRSFLDHDRPFLPPDDPAAAAERATGTTGVFVDAAGGAIAPADALQSLVEHLRRWRAVTSRHGIVLLEVHCLEPAASATHIDESESLHFDAYHGFSRQQLVEARAFLDCAAEAGLFPRPRFFRRYPRLLPYTRITMNHFACREYALRAARCADLPALLALEQACWPHGMATPEDVLRERLEHNPDGHCVVEYRGEIVAAAATQRIDGIDALGHAAYRDHASLRRSDGPVLQMLALLVRPDLQHLGIGDELLQFTLCRARVVNGITDLVGISRCKSFPGGDDVAYRRYVSSTGPDGLPVDPILRFHARHGATVRSVLPEYRPEDVDNLGHGVLIAYDLAAPIVEPLDPDETAAASIGGATAEAARDTGPSARMIVQQLVTDTLARLAPGRFAEPVPVDQPLLELGLDSMDVMELRLVLARRSGRSLDTTFLFEHGTIERIAAWFSAHGGLQATPTVAAEALCFAGASPDVMPALASTQTDGVEPVAAVAMACRFPGAPDVDAFWRLLSTGGCAVRDLPAPRWDERPGDLRRAAYLDDAERFDAGFFRISPGEAELMDPQQRLLLETTWQMLESEGISPASLRGERVGVFVGACHYEYRDLLRACGVDADAYLATGTFSSIISNRLSYFYDFHGPSVTIDTACSSSLVALHEAVQSLRRGESSAAVVAGVNIICSGVNTRSFQRAGILSPDAVCRTFDASANGYVRGEGVGAVLLKPLSRARRDGDRIHGLVRGSAVAHGGSAASLTAPSPQAQADVVAMAYRDAGVQASRVAYIEAHGTATALGDPIEIAGLRAAFVRLAGPGPAPECAVGSLKPNIGHLEGAAGIAGLIKVLLCMRHGQLAPNIHYRHPNPRIAFEDGPFRVVTALERWRSRDGLPLVAGVSSFGFGGTIAHAVIESAPAAPAGTTVRAAGDGPQLIVLSARTDTALRAVAARLHAHLRTEAPRCSFAEVAATLQRGRAGLPVRAAFVARDFADMLQRLDACARAEAMSGIRIADVRHAGSELPSETQVASWTRARDLSSLAAAWTRGAEIEWSALHDVAVPHRLPLPVYPFEAQRYWPQLPETDDVSDALSLYTSGWIPAQPAAGTAPRLQRIACVADAETFAMLAAGWAVLPDAARAAVWRVEPHTDPQALACALRTAEAAHGRADAIVLAWRGVAGDVAGAAAAALALVHAVAADNAASARVLLTGEARDDIQLAALEAWCGVAVSAPRARPDIAVGVALRDLRAGADAAWPQRVWAELNAEPQAQSLWRGDVRLAPRIMPVNRPAALSAIRERGCYIVTGGLGGIGYALAGLLAARYRCRLVLIGRRADDAAVGERIASLAALGGEAIYCCADVADAAALEGAFAAARARYGRIDGILHCAGRYAHAPLPTLAADEVHALLAPKLQGTLALAALAAAHRVDTLCLFSSIAAVSGDFGACAYALGNRFQLACADALSMRHPGLRVVAVGWPVWRSGGIVLGSDEHQRAYLAASRQHALDDETGLALLGALLAADGNAWLVVPAERSAADALLATAVSTGSEPRVDNGARPAPALEAAVLAHLIQLASEQLKLAPATLHADVNLAEFGFDSIGLRMYAARIAGAYGIDLQAPVFFRHGTFAAIAAHLCATARQACLHRHGVSGGTNAPQHAVEATAEASGAGHHPAPIAIIGMSGRFPGCADIDAFWETLAGEHSRIDEVPPARAEWSATTGAARPRIGMLDGVRGFSPSFFGISPREAHGMDPRQRLLLQESWRALENAALGEEVLDSGGDVRLGVFVGVEQGNYAGLARGASRNLTDNHDAVLAARLSYLLDLSGPVVSINTACSSGLVAAHLACQSLWTGESDVALAASANLLLDPGLHAAMDEAGMLSPGGRPRTFSAAADGMVPGEAVVAVVFKPLVAAERDGDPILAVVLASGTNYDGRTNGLTAPSGKRQAMLVKDMYREFRIDPRRIGYVVCHGTATPLGDPVELNALAEAWEGTGVAVGACAVGSNKPNVGHALAASGLVNLVHMVEALRRAEIPGNLGCEPLTRAVDWDRLPFRAEPRLRPWPVPANGSRVGAISAFGMSGTNAHMVIEAHAPAHVPAQAASAGPRLLVLSAKHPDELRARCAQLVPLLLHARDAGALDAICHTLARGRLHFRHRCAVIAEDAADAAAQLARIAAGESPVHAGTAPLAGAVDGDADLPPNADTASLHALAAAYCAGRRIAWRRLPGMAGTRRTALPPYPFREQDYWFDALPGAPSADQAGQAGDDAGIGTTRGRALRLADPEAVLAGRPARAPAALSVTAMPQAEGGVPALTGDGDVLRLTLNGASIMAADTDAALATLAERIAAADRAGCRVLVLEIGPAPFTADALQQLDAGRIDALRAAASGARACLLVRIDADHGDAGAWLLASLGDLVLAVASSPQALDHCGQDGPLRGIRIAAPALADTAESQLCDAVRGVPAACLTLLKAHMGRPLPAVPSRVRELLLLAEGLPERQPASREEIVLGLSHVRVSMDDTGVALIEMRDSTQRNMFTSGLVEQLRTAFTHVGQNLRCRVAVLTGYDGCFSAGGDRHGLVAIQAGALKFTDYGVYALALEAHVPVIAAMQGHAFGAGWSLGLFADVAVYAEQAVYCCPYVSFGFTPGAGATLALPVRYGSQLAHEVLYTGIEYRGRELRERGIPDPVLPREQVLPYALALAARLAQLPRERLIAIKAPGRAALLALLDDTYSQELQMHERTFVGNVEVLRRIDAHFGERSADAPDHPPMPQGAPVVPPSATAPVQASATTGSGITPDALRARLTGLLSEELMLPPEDIAADRPFSELGLDSVIGVSWVRRIGRTFGIALKATRLYEFPTLAQFASHVHALLPAAVSSATAPTEPRDVEAEVEAAANVPVAAATDRIAIIGMAGRFPGADDLDAFWRNLAEGRDCVSEVPASRWAIDAYYSEDGAETGRTYGRWMGAVDSAEVFDPLFFGISPREAEYMDPQQRLFLQACWHALEDAGYDPTWLADARCGVFAGCSANDYGQTQPSDANLHGMTGSEISVLAGRVAYHLDLHGPCLAIDTACSSSLVAIVEAANALRLGGCDLALAGGVCVMAGPRMHLLTAKAGMLSRRGRCATFDEDADGFVPAEGVGVVVLKRLSDARRDGDVVDAVLAGWGTNQDGRTNGITAPNLAAQSALQEEVYREFGIDPSTFQLVECHGTGTRLGDPIEVDALLASFARWTARPAYCALGSVKSNIGHALAAAGVASLIKVVLALRHRKIPPTLHVKRANVHLALDDGPFYLNTALVPWPAGPGGVRRAAINSFGFSGSNAHVVVECADPVPGDGAPPGTGAPVLVPVSARTPEALRMQVQQLLAFVDAAGDGLDLQRFACTLQLGRCAMECRMAILAADAAALRATLARYLRGETVDDGLFVGSAGEGVAASLALDEDIADLVPTWIERGRHARLLSLWVGGADVDWRLLYGEAPPRRMHLPGYPFARERYWLPLASMALSGQVAAAGPGQTGAVAVIGMACEFPQARGADAFWRNLAEGRDAITCVPSSRWDWREVHGDPRAEHNRTNVNCAGFIDGFAEFDPLFFGISPREAEYMDPQQRLSMAAIWNALEDAGHAPSSLRGNDVAIFIGTTSTPYHQLLKEAGRPLEGYSGLGMSSSLGANRMSFLLDLHGPSEAVDTACSSSLVAIHKAVRAIRAGECTLAIAGGVNLILSPDLHISFSRAGMLSPDGRSKTFSRTADGYGRGEGLGMLVLKPLDAALRDGDHVYGSILGSALNHGGAAPTLTAPNALAQAAVIRRAWRDAGVAPAAISYIETHGTGTPLGDRVEVAALREVFAEAGERHRCVLGSVKTNIGSLEYAAGVASVIKVLLQMRHRTLVPHLHCDALHPDLKLDDGPLQIARHAQPWLRTHDDEGRERPLTAGVSSFGFGGVNAHLVIREHVPAVAARPRGPRPLACVLSAKTPEQLRGRIADLLDALRHGRFDEHDLDDIAYTLQVGREAFEYRYAAVVDGIDDLRQALQAALDGAVAHALDDASPAASRQGSDQAALAAAWRGGQPVDWTVLYAGAHRRRVPLPGYPFARDVYWVGDDASPATARATRFAARGAQRQEAAEVPSSYALRPRAADTAGDRYAMVLAREAYYFSEHVVRGERILPGVAHLELVRAAAALRMGAGPHDATAWRFSSVVWLRPLVSRAAVERVAISFMPAAASELDYRVCADASAGGTYSQGRIAPLTGPTPERLDLSALHARCSEDQVEADEIYRLFRSFGIDHGTLFRGLVRVQLGRDAAGRMTALGRVRLDPTASEAAVDAMLHPGMLDSVLQVCIATPDTRAGGTTKLPFAIERMDVLAPTPASGYVWLREAAPEAGDARRYDIDLCDDAGRICVAFRGFMFRVYGDGTTGTESSVGAAPTAPALEPADALEGDLMLAPRWDPIPYFDPSAAADADAILLLHREGVFMPAWNDGRTALRPVPLRGDEDVAALQALLARCGPFRRVLVLLGGERAPAGDARMVAAQDRGVLLCFRLYKALQALGLGQQPLQCVFATRCAMAVDPRDAVRAHDAGVHGLVGCMARETPAWTVRLVDLPAEVSPQPRYADLFALPVDVLARTFAHRDGRWLAPSLARVEPVADAPTVYRAGAVYVVIGGAGGIGGVWTEHVLRRCRAQVIWIGRREPDAALEARLDRLAMLGPRPEYVRADATDPAALVAACEAIVARHGAIHGVVHAALALLDQGLQRMDEARMRDALAAKVDTCVAMAAVLRGQPLDFVLLFSSTLSFSRSAGQANYAAGCTFEDAYAHQLAREWGCAVKVMHWGYWGSIGVVASAEYRERMARIGVGSIEAGPAMSALDALLASPWPELVFYNSAQRLAEGEVGAIGLPIIGRSAYAAPSALASVPLPPEAFRAACATMALPQRYEDRGDGALLQAMQARMLLRALRRAGMVAADGSVAAPERSRIAGRHHDWARAGIGLLQEAGLLDMGTTGPRVSLSVPGDEGLHLEWMALRDELALQPSLAPLARLLDPVFSALEDVLSGDLAATSVLFPGGSMQLLEPIYNGNPVVDYFNDATVACVRRLVEAARAAAPDRPLAILEIGAGTGGTSRAMFAMLAGHAGAVAEYCYTDVSPAFLAHAERQYAALAPGLRTRLLDIQHDIAAQGFQFGRYDIVIAANVLHATRAIDRTLANAKALLGAGGALVMNEITDRSLFRHMTFGLLREWWDHGDGAVRIPGCPGLTPAGWRRLLDAAGFDAIDWPVAHAHGVGQQVIVARSDGRVQLEAPAAAAPAVAMAPAPTVPVPATPVPDQAALAEAVAGLLARTMRIPHERIRSHTPFSDYGVDSITGVELVQAINRQLGLSLATTALFDCPTIARLVAHIATRQGAGPVPATPAASLRAAEPARTAETARTDVHATATERPAADAAALGELLAAELADAMRVPPARIRHDRAFTEYGVDSITGVELVDRINRRLGVDLQATALFDHATIGRLAAHIAAHHAPRLADAAAPTPARDPQVQHVALDAAVPSRAAPALAAPAVAAPAITAPAAGSGRIAVIGMACRVPGADGIESLWQALAAGRDLVREVSRWLPADFEGCEPGEERYARHGALFDDIAAFDAEFFGISGLEASYMDPQHRLFLEEAWHALEDAGCADGGAGMRCGVYVGTIGHDYDRLFRGPAPPQAFWGNAGSVLASRISYALDLKGPALAVDTACSSSLVAIHLACQAVRTGEVGMALAGGVTVLNTPAHYLLAGRAGMLSPGGRCRSFSASADGFVPAEGVGVIVLKGEAQALADGDRIHGVIAAVAVNQDGTSNGIVAPNGSAQEALIAGLYASAGLDPAGIQYYEAHGTGTRLGDPIEFSAATRAFRRFTDRRGFCALGTIKSNLGHAAAAAGVAGVIKCLLALRHGTIPPTLHVDAVNPRIPLEDSPFFINTAMLRWRPGADGRRRAAVSAFGFGGTNAHIVVEEAQQATGGITAGDPELVVLSAQTAAQLRALAAAFTEEGDTRLDAIALVDVARTLLLGRRHFTHRLALVAHDARELRARLRAWCAGSAGSDVLDGRADSSEAARHPALKMLGEQCVRECAAGTSADRSARLRALADLYVQGHALDWTLLFPPGRGRTASLPGYPFARTRYWWDRLPDESRRDAAPVAAAALRLYRQRWQPQAATGSGRAPRAVVGFVGDLEQGRVIEAALGAAAALRWVVPADMAVEKDDATLAERLRILCAGADAVLFLWPALAPSPVRDERMVLALASALGQVAVDGAAGVRLLLAGQASDAGERCGIASWAGIGPSLAPRVKLHVVCASGGDASPAAWAGRIGTELAMESPSDVLYVGDVRHLQTFEPVALRPGASALREAGTYVITGGFGGLGRALATYLSVRYRADLVLVGRGAPDAAGDSVMAALRRYGATVRYVRADVTDRADVQRLVDAVTADGRRVDGVFHLAGAFASAPLDALDPATIDAVLAPKRSGTRIIAEAFAGSRPGFICHYASAAAVLGDGGACVYAIGNRYQLARADAAGAADGAREIAIAWPLWQGGAMVDADAESTRRFLSATGQAALPDALGFEVLEHVLGEAGGSWLALYGQPDALDALLAGAGVALATPAMPAVPVRSTTASAATAGAAAIRAAAAAVLRVPQERLDDDRSFGALGFDSILLAQLAVRLGARFGAPVPASALFDHPTIGRLAAHLAATRGAPVPAGEAHADSPVPAEGCPPAAAEAADTGGAVAVVGMSGRFPGARDVDAFWELLRTGADAVVSVQPRFGGIGATVRLGELPGAWEFDPAFFEVHPRYARTMDPRARLLLQEGWNAFEDAGIDPTTLARTRVGLYVGLEAGDFGHRDTVLNGSNAIAASHLAYLLDLDGPVLAIDTACSSGLVAAHQACQALRAGECSLALVTAANMVFQRASLDVLAEAGILSPGGACRTFSSAADGIVPGEAVVALVLKPLQAALRDHDLVQAVVLGSAVNYDGKTNGIAAPSGLAQTALIERAMRQAGVEPARIGYAVLHGTGTELGDAVELDALQRAWAGRGGERAWITSNKANVGHCLAASGLVSVVNIVQALRSATVPPAPHAGELNAHVDWSRAPFAVNRSARPWPAADGDRCGMISAFGMSGTNACMLLSAPPPQSHASLPGPFLLPLSARTPDALQSRVRALLAMLGQHGEEGEAALLARVSWTLCRGRASLALRRAVVADTLAQALALLRAVLETLVDDGARGPAPGLLPGATLPAGAREAEVARVGERWCAGEPLDADVLFGGRRLVPVRLPGYPFAREQHVPDDVSAAASAGAPQAMRAPVRLGDPNRVATPAAPASRSMQARLASLDATVAGPSVVLEAETDGVLRLAWPADAAHGPVDALLTALGDAFARASADPRCRVLRISGGDGGFCPLPAVLPPEAEQRLCALLDRLDVPLVATLSSARSTGFSAVLLCLADFAAANRDAVLSFPASAVLDPSLRGRLRARAGAALLDRLDAHGTTLAGKAAAAVLPGMRWVQAADVEDEACRLARELAAQPRLALTLLKRHLADAIEDAHAPAAAGARVSAQAAWLDLID